MMKHPMFALSLRKTMLMAVLVLLAMGACKSKKKAVEPAPAPVVKEEAAPVKVQAPAAVVRSAEEIAVEKLESQFASIASASNVTAANQSIQEVLAMFSNQETPILIVIHEEGGVKDYDEPTTIKKYLEYLKDTKKNLNHISDIRLAGGKVTELELKRK
jgi:hypothetical protein